VHVLINRDVVKGMEVHKQAGVLEQNIFMFPATRKSTVLVNDWHFVRRICSATEVEALSSAHMRRDDTSTREFVIAMHDPSVSTHNVHVSC